MHGSEMETGDLVVDAGGPMLEAVRWFRMQLTGLVIAVIVGAIRTRAAVADAGSHAVDLGACGE